MTKNTISLLKTILLSLITFISVSCAPHGPTHYRSNGAYQTFDFSESHTYREYQTSMRKKLTENWQDLFATDSNYMGREKSQIATIVNHLMPTNTSPIKQPGEGKPKRSILLVHGLYDSPYLMRDLEQFFRGQGFHTRSLLLPGHGTRPGNLISISRNEWIKAVNFGVRSLHKDIGGRVYLAGFSTGASLALRQSLTRPESVDGLFLFSPSLEVPAQSMQKALKAVGFRWLPFQKLADKDFARYESGSLDAAYETSQLGTEVQSLLAETTPKIPIMIVAAESDYTIKTEVTRRLFEDRKFGDQSKMLIYSPTVESSLPDSRASSLSGGKPKYVPMIINSRFNYEMDQKLYRIADYSHNSITAKPDHPHYGLNGNYRYCHHYFLWPGSSKNRNRCSNKSNNRISFGERKMIGAQSYPSDQKRTIVRRLTCNPKFAHLEEVMADFITQQMNH